MQKVAFCIFILSLAFALPNCPKLPLLPEVKFCVVEQSIDEHGCAQQRFNCDPCANVTCNVFANSECRLSDDGRPICINSSCPKLNLTAPADCSVHTVIDAHGCLAIEQLCGPCKDMQCGQGKECRLFGDDAAICIDRSCPRLSGVSVPDGCRHQPIIGADGCLDYELQCRQCDSLACEEGKECRAFDADSLICIDKSCPRIDSQLPMPPDGCRRQTIINAIGCLEVRLSCEQCENLTCADGKVCRLFDAGAVTCVDKSCPQIDAQLIEPPEGCRRETIIKRDGCLEVEIICGECVNMTCAVGEQCRSFDKDAAICVDRACPIVSEPLAESGCTIQEIIAEDGCPNFEQICT